MALVHVEQLSGSIMMPKEAHFTEVLARQNCLNQFGVANFPHTFCIGHFGGTRQRHSNPQHIIVTSDSGSE